MSKGNVRVKAYWTYNDLLTYDKPSAVHRFVSVHRCTCVARYCVMQCVYDTDELCGTDK